MLDRESPIFHEQITNRSLLLKHSISIKYIQMISLLLPETYRVETKVEAATSWQEKVDHFSTQEPTEKDKNISTTIQHQTTHLFIYCLLLLWTTGYQLASPSLSLVRSHTHIMLYATPHRMRVEFEVVILLGGVASSGLNFVRRGGG